MRLFHKTNFDFMKWRRIAIGGSVVAILVGIVSLILKGGPAYNIDFLGGTEIQIQFQQSKKVEDLRNVLASVNYASAEIKEFGHSKSFLIRFSEVESKTGSGQIMTSLKQAFPTDEPELQASNVIGPKVGEELRTSAVLAVLVTLVLLLVYIGFRFHFIFGVGAVVALFHDVLMTLGFFSVLNLEISVTVVGAFLTLVGYSLNDTIVIFDRIRENMKVHRREMLSISQVINLSINETLSRTVVTGVTTLIVIIVCLLFGGEVLRDFFLCLFFGILVGTYSSVFIAAPVVAGWFSKKGAKKVESHSVVYN